MKSMLVAILSLLLCAASGAASAREVGEKGERPYRPWTVEEFAGVEPLFPELMRAVAQVDTYTIVRYDFETMSLQGWTQVDNTADPDTFWHVDDFAGLGGGDYGGLVPLEGTKSMWCGARPDVDEYLCTWHSAPGYGNSWIQGLVSDPIDFEGSLTLSYHGYFDSEPDCDYTFVEYDAGEGNWQELARYDGVQEVTETHVISPAIAATKLRFRFVSDGAWSDEDGLWNTDGAAIIDSITVSDMGGVIDYEDFEAAAVGALNAGVWHADLEEGFGIYSGTDNPGGRSSGWTGELYDQDPCNSNLSSQIVFNLGSCVTIPEDPICPTPFCKGAGGLEAPCQDEMVVSPVIDMTKYTTADDEVQDADIPPGALPGLGGLQFTYTVYEDLPLANCVFYTWLVRNLIDGCPGPWRKRHSTIYGDDREYKFIVNEISDLVDPNEPLQVALRVRDMCDVWYLVYCNCADHAYAPWFDNVRIKRYSTAGPQWGSRDLDLFQDNFPSDGTDVESFVRADMANDMNPYDNPIFRPGDSIVVFCASPIAGGIAEDAFGPKIYMHVKCTYIGPAPAKPSLAGPALEGTYGTYIGDNGVWTIIQGDSAEVGAGLVVPDRYMFDLNDSLFTRGYLIEYYFSAEDLNGIVTTLPQHAGALPEEHPYRGGSNFFEFTCLPTLASDILYVDDFHGRGSHDGVVQLYFDRTIMDVFPPGSWFDRYDVNSPSSRVGNGPASRASLTHLSSYSGIVWDSGNLRYGTIGDGSSGSDKSNDCQMLIDWMDQHGSSSNGLWILGDHVAEDLDGLTSPQAQTLMETWCGVTLEGGSYFDLSGGLSAGGIPIPLIHTVAGGIYTNPMHPDSLCLEGGCPNINDFDVLGKTGDGEYMLQYPDAGAQHCYAGIGSRHTNGLGQVVNTMWFGFSFMYIRDCGEAVPIVRNRIMETVIQDWMNGIGGPPNPDITGGEVPPAWSLAQNYPNPFNPATAIRYSVREKGSVSLRIYNVAGQLVRILVDEVKEQGGHTALWDGRNDRGARVASGIYFYEMEAKEFRSTKKMVLLQ